jgi:tight adherence protein B
MSPLLLTLLTFLAAVLAVVGLYSVWRDLFARERVAKRLDDEFRGRQREQIRSSPLFKDLGRLAREANEEERTATLGERFAAMVAQSGVNVTTRRLMVLAAVAGVAAAFLLGVIRPNIFVAAAGGLVGAAVPVLFVYAKWKARMDKMLRQLPDAFDLMSRVIRAGQSMTQAMQAVADEFDQPLAGEFGYCYEQQNLGLPPEVSLRDLARRTGLLEIKIFVLALLVQQQSGGNLAEVLDKLAGVVRERFRIRSKIKALTAEGRMQALVLLVLPFALMGLLMVMNSQYAATVMKYPGIVVLMLVIEGLGAVWIRKIVNFDY